MTPELTALALATLLLLAQFLHVATLANLEIGQGYFLGPRDAAPDRPLSTRTARLERAYKNMREWLLPFAIAAGLATATGSTPVTAACAWIFLAARVLYIPAYTFGWVPWRSVIWLVGFLATAVMISAALV